MLIFTNISYNFSLNKLLSIWLISLESRNYKRGGAYSEKRLQTITVVFSSLAKARKVRGIRKPCSEKGGFCHCLLVSCPEQAGPVSLAQRGPSSPAQLLPLPAEGLKQGWARFPRFHNDPVTRRVGCLQTFKRLFPFPVLSCVT